MHVCVSVRTCVMCEACCVWSMRFCLFGAYMCVHTYMYILCMGVRVVVVFFVCMRTSSKALIPFSPHIRSTQEPTTRHIISLLLSASLLSLPFHFHHFTTSFYHICFYMYIYFVSLPFLSLYSSLVMFLYERWFLKYKACFSFFLLTASKVVFGDNHFFV